MRAFKREFLDLALELGALRFGEFTLKSGRKSPYFFNAGLFNTGRALARLGQYYADTIVDSGIQFDTLFGPAYKGIPLVAATAVALANDRGLDIPYVFNRKEAKDHGEGGSLIGAELVGRAVIVDDVITAGTAIREAMAVIEHAGARLAGVVIAVDREEKGQGDISAIREIEQTYGVSVTSIVSFSDILEYMVGHDFAQNSIDAMRAYQLKYGV